MEGDLFLINGEILLKKEYGIKVNSLQLMRFDFYFLSYIKTKFFNILYLSYKK